MILSGGTNKMRGSTRNSLSIAAILIVCTLVQLSSGQGSCRNPNGRSGTCISIHDCPVILSVIRRIPLQDADIQFAQQSQCQNGAGIQPLVCCTTDTGFTGRSSPVTPTPTPKPTSLPGTSRSVNTAPGNGEGTELPTPPRCGQMPAGDRIYNGNDTLLDEFPWMVLLEYVQRGGGRILNCGGSLINRRYVLTAAHCVTGAILREVGQLDRVRLGEYDLSKDIDCVSSDCADPVVNMGIENVIPHPQFDESSPNRQNDIALIRLNDVVTYTDFIKPVCLPSALSLQAAPRTGTNLVVAGWGRTLSSRQSNIKQKLFVPVNDHQDCSQKFSTKRIEISPSQICVGGRFSEDSCDGDSGGPLMQLTKETYALEGIVSFGNRCGLEDWPGVYTKVSVFESWIKNNLRP